MYTEISHLDANHIDQSLTLAENLRRLELHMEKFELY